MSPFFFNAQIETPFAGEDRQIILVPKSTEDHTQTPDERPRTHRATLKRIADHHDDFILINPLANPDMVGHTGIISAAITACEAADEGLGQDRKEMPQG
ncbi:MAG: hypothetical protein R2865_14570 [Deinococcales bacterium]